MMPELLQALLAQGVQMFLVLLIAPAVVGVTRQVKARLTRRRGAPILQSYRDLIKLVRKEAVLSSMIEGTQSSLADLLLLEIDEQPGVPMDDAKEVSRYVKALEHGLKRIRGGFPISSRLIREVHEVLMRSGRGGHLTPGQFRRSQVWVGGTRPGNAVFVPPPASELICAVAARPTSEMMLFRIEALPPLTAAMPVMASWTVLFTTRANGRNTSNSSPMPPAYERMMLLPLIIAVLGLPPI